MRNLIIIVSLIFSVLSCQQKPKQQVNPKPAKQKKELQSDWSDIVPSLVKITSYDNNRILEKGEGFFIDEDIIVTKYSNVSNANKVFVTPYDETNKYQANNYVAFDRINDLILLKVEGIKRNPIKLYNGIVPNSAKSICVAQPKSKTIPLRTGKVLSYSNIKGVKLYRITNQIRTNTFGLPVLVSNKSAIGVAFSEVVDYERQSFAIPSTFIAGLMEKSNGVSQSLESLRSSSSKEIAARNSRIKGLLIETDMGNISIRLFNETAEYRDNFIKLVKEKYYDSLLIHRVIRGLGIQSGAADTRYATKDDVVGWKGPGYTIPAHIVPKYFHKRGMIGVPRKPDKKNARRRSDGSQYYIVSGRLYNDSELDDIEKENNYKFSAEQRRIYKTIGGAPHLDGAYTVFGEVISGMNVVDLISKVETDRDFRPVNDIRIKRIRIIE